MAGLSGCDGPQSALDPAGRAAEQIARLFWKMAVGTVLVWLAMVGLTMYATRGARTANEERLAKLLIIGGGAIVPTAILAALLVYGIGMMPNLLARAPEGSLEIHVTGEQWWWRVRYRPPHGTEVILANEIRLPLGETVEFQLESSDVIHSFWIPALGGKMDMIPGRTTRLALEATRPGVFRGVCAEYCGTAHALMAFSVVVMPREEFEQWLNGQRLAAPATRGGCGDAGTRRISHPWLRCVSHYPRHIRRRGDRSRFDSCGESFEHRRRHSGKRTGSHTPMDRAHGQA